MLDSTVLKLISDNINKVFGIFLRVYHCDNAIKKLALISFWILIRNFAEEIVFFLI